MISARPRRRGARLVLAVLFLSAQLLTLGCGMANPALTALLDGSQHTEAAVDNGPTAAPQSDMSHGHHTPETPPESGHAHESDDHESDDHSSDGHHDDACLTTMSCSANAVRVGSVVLFEGSALTRIATAQVSISVPSVDLDGLRRPPRSV